MDFGLNEDQRALVDAVQSIRRPFDALPMAHKRDRSWFAASCSGVWPRAAISTPPARSARSKPR